MKKPSKGITLTKFLTEDKLDGKWENPTQLASDNVFTGITWTGNSFIMIGNQAETPTASKNGKVTKQN